MRSLIALYAALLLVSCGNKPAEPLPATGVDKTVFLDVAAQSGLDFTHVNGASGKFEMPEIMGAGAALLDYDGDGDLDAYLVQSQDTGKLFRNELVPGGTLRFVDVTSGAGITFSGYGMGVATGDIDADGRPDMLVTGYGSRRLYRNQGNGTFAEVALPPPPVPNTWSTSASFFDYDRDGRQDLIVLSYVNFTREGNKRCIAPTGETDYCTPKAYSPMAARLYHNEGGNTFRDVTAQAGIDRAMGPGLGVAALDLNEDGWPDLFVANDTAANHVWMNQKNGTFRELGVESGAAYSEDGLAKAGMGVAAGDSDGDGDEDLFVVNLMREGATLFRNEGVSPQGWPMFLDVTRSSGIYQATFPNTGFGTDWFDYDNDGRLDLFIANGAVTLKEDQRGQPVPFKERRQLLHNEGGGKFKEVQVAGTFSLPEVSRGAAFGDIDNDGDVDILVSNNNGPARLFRNDSPSTGWVTVVPQASQPLGAKITLYREDLMPLVRRVHTDSSYCSASDARVHFGLGDKSGIGSVEVVWPDGTMETWEAPPARKPLLARKGTGKTPVRTNK